MTKYAKGLIISRATFMKKKISWLCWIIGHKPHLWMGIHQWHCHCNRCGRPLPRVKVKLLLEKDND